MVGHLERMESGLRELRRATDVELHERVDLRAWTALGVGGQAALVARCHNENGVRLVLDLVASHGIGWVTLGGGSRLIAPDHGIRVPVISLTGELACWEPELDGVVAGGGANLAQVCRAAQRAGLSGLESLASRRHSIGGLICAAADGAANLDKLLDWVDLLAPGAETERWQSTSSQPVPERSDLQRRVVLRVRFRLSASGMADILPTDSRRPGRRALRSTGPVFLDTADASAGDLLAEVEMATASVGGARFGGATGNELLAGRSATAGDVLDLCRRARDRVRAATGIELRSALVFVDEDGWDLGL